MARTSPAYADTAAGQADALYAPYVERQAREWAAVQGDAERWLPRDLDFSTIPGLSAEMGERLNAARPETIDQARRISGISPAALTALFMTVARRAA